MRDEYEGRPIGVLARRIRERVMTMREEAARWDNEERREWPPRPREHQDIYFSPPDLGWLNTAIGELDAALENEGFVGQPPALGEDEFWSLGATTVRFEPTEFHRGYIQALVRIPFAVPLSDRVVAFISIADGDWLERETHNMGYHYHYLDRNKRRSNVILCWDTRAPRPDDLDKNAVCDWRPLFWEHHGEGHAKFEARPERWGQFKRETAFAACRRDLRRGWPITAFKPASNDAQPLYPPGSTLTPRTSATPVTTSAKPKAKKARR